MEWPEPCSTSYSHLSQGSSPGIDAEQDIQRPQVISGPSVQEGAVRDVLQSPDHNRGSARLSSSERLMTGQNGLLWEQGEHQHPLPTLLQKGGGEQGQLGDHSVPDWQRQIRSPPLLRNVARGGAAGAGRRVATSLALQEKYQPCSPRERSRSSPCTARFMGPSRLKKSSEHFSKSSLRQKLQSDKCKSQPDLQLLPFLSQPRAASEVTLAPQVVGTAMGSVQVVVGAPLAPP